METIKKHGEKLERGNPSMGHRSCGPLFPELSEHANFSRFTLRHDYFDHFVPSMIA
jgi:hypothetical protein